MSTKSKPKKTIILHMLILGMILFGQIFYQVVYAQDTQENLEQEILIQSDPALKLRMLSPTEQDFPNKNFKITLEIDSLISSNRVGVQWTYPKNLLHAIGGDADTVTVTSGNKTTIVKEFALVPNPPKTTINLKVDISTRVNGFVAGENYISTQKVGITLNPDMEIFPVLSNYSRAKNMNTMRNIVIIAVVIVLIVIGLFLGINKFMKYLNTPDVT